MADRVGASATVTVTMEIDAFSTWGPGCSIDQIERQATAEVVNAVERFLKEKRIHVRLIGKPIVKSVITRR